MQELPWPVIGGLVVALAVSLVIARRCAIPIWKGPVLVIATIIGYLLVVLLLKPFSWIDAASPIANSLISLSLIILFVAVSVPVGVALRLMPGKSTLIATCSLLGFSLSNIAIMLLIAGLVPRG